jgi:hypothetical protein
MVAPLARAVLANLRFRSGAADAVQVSPMRILKCLCVVFFLATFAGLCRAADGNLKVVVLDSNTGHSLHGKLVCISFPLGDPNAAVIERSRDCRRTDSEGSAAFSLPNPAPEKIDIRLASDRLVECFSGRNFVLTEAMQTGIVAKNTCGDAGTETTQSGEVVLFAHQNSLWDAMKSHHNEF